jgi:hypothetical protein
MTINVLVPAFIGTHGTDAPDDAPEIQSVCSVAASVREKINHSE